MVCFIIENENILQAHEFGHDALDHLSFGFECIQALRHCLEEGPPALRQLHAVAEFKGMVVRNHDLSPFEIAKHVAGNQFAARIVAVRIIGLKHASRSLNSEARRDNQKPASEVGTARPPDGVDSLPGDDHRHNSGFTRAGRQFQRKSQKVGIRVLIGVPSVRETFTGFSHVWCNLRQPDCCLDSLDLTKEWADIVELELHANAEEAARFRVLPANHSDSASLRHWST